MNATGNRDETVLGISIVNYRTAGHVAELVESLMAGSARDGVRLLIALVDNSTQHDELAVVAKTARAAGIECHVIEGHGNVGYAAGNNLGGAWLIGRGADIVWILNPDTRLAGGRMSAVTGLLDPDDRAIGATARTGDARPDLGALHLWTGQSGAPAGSASRDRLSYVSGHSILITRRAWQDLDGMCENYFLFYEEADLAMRCRELGIPTRLVAGLTVDHAGGAATGATGQLTRKSTLTYFHASRSSMVFFRRHLPRRLPVALAARLAYAARVLLAAGPGPAGAVVRGAFAGLRAG